MKKVEAIKTFSVPVLGGGKLAGKFKTIQRGDVFYVSEQSADVCVLNPFKIFRQLSEVAASLDMNAFAISSKYLKNNFRDCIPCGRFTVLD